MEGRSLLLPLAFLAAVFKGITYFAVFWSCSMPAIPALDGRRLERAFIAGAARALLGVLSTPLFIMMLSSLSQERWAWLFPFLHGVVRVLFWLAVLVIVYRKAPFRSSGYRLYFWISVVVSGMLLNAGWDYVLSQGRWNC